MDFSIDLDTQLQCPDDSFFLHINKQGQKVNLQAWLRENRAFLSSNLNRYGAILLRGFDVPDANAFANGVRGMSERTLQYNERAAKRVEVVPGVYTSTHFSKNQWIPLHHEMSYSHQSPLYIYFYCAVAPQTQGRTPIANERVITRKIPQEISQEFIARGGVKYIRNFNAMVDVSWQDAFQIENKNELEHYLRQNFIEWEWVDEDHLKTYQTRQVFATHPKTHEQFWFNHAHMFHISNMPEELSSTLVTLFGEEGLPRNAFYGDGTPIDNKVVDFIRSLYSNESVSFEWQQGDMLLLDNFICSHGREPFSGERSILVAMSDMVTHKLI